MDLTTRYCPDCHEDRLFDRPHETGQCPDAVDESGECPELACTGCGVALVIAFTPGGGAAGLASWPAAPPLAAERDRLPGRAA